MPHPADLLTTVRLVELTKTMVAIPSVTGGEQRLADWVAAFLGELGLRNVRRLAVDEAGDSVVAEHGAAGGPALMLNFHLDTFDVFDGWRTAPFAPTQEGRWLYGLGAHDMKGGAACVLGAVEAIVRSGTQLGGRLFVSATSDEENWSRGVHALIRSGLLEGCAGCLVPEPSAAGTLTVGQRGRHVFRLAFYGRAAHAAYGGGVNAVADAARVASLLSAPGAVGLGHSQEFGLSGSICVSGLHGGGTLILVPERAELFVDRHILPGERAEQAAAQIRAVVERAGVGSRWELRWDERPTPAPGPFVVGADTPLVRVVRGHLAREQGREVRLVLGRSVADTNHFAVHGGVPTLICGPQGGNTCEANEYVEVDSLLPIARTYVHSVLELLGAA
ncbi:MAG TPA: M20/M25/M40 family metallo-hydrolase [Roseiflexaceae bacterium]|nr:M20/M25/M40 family metallo-hydrolase [Roseiflexaceae bacterium]